MLLDPRIEKLAKGLVGYSCDVQKGENVLIEATGADYQLINCLIKEIYKAGGRPFVTLNDARIQREILKGLDEGTVKQWAEFDIFKMQKMQAYIGIRGGENSYETSDVLPENMNMYSSLYSHPVHHDIRVDKTKWVILRYPTQGMSQLSGMSTEAFEDMYFDVCTLDYKKMDDAMTPLVALMQRTDKVRLVADDTDISFSIKGIPAIKCSGLRNIPDGEVYTAPVKNSVNGVIHYNVPSINRGIKFEDVRLEFKDGKIIYATANHTDALNKLLDIDEGARYVGEFAIGVNPFITNAMGDILFDEKISGSIHFTPGACYTEASNGNQSAAHWDLVLVQTPDFGGGEIWFDGVLIRKDGRFTVPELLGLNPENLM